MKLEFRTLEWPMPLRFGMSYKPDFEFPAALAEPLAHPAEEKQPIRRRNIGQADESGRGHGAYNLSRGTNLGTENRRIYKGKTSTKGEQLLLRDFRVLRGFIPDFGR